MKTLEEAYRELGPSLWRGAKDQKMPYARLEVSLAFLGKQKDVSTVNYADIRSLIDHLYESEVSGSTINRYLSAMSKFLQACVKNGYLDEVPSFDWQKESAPKSRWLSPEERETLISTLLKYPSRELGYATAAFCRLALLTGARRGEILKVNPKTDVVDGVVTFRDTKNGTHRSIPITPDAVELFHDYCPWNYETTGENRFRDRMYDAWNWAREEMGLSEDEEFTFHALRHTFASILNNKGVDIHVVKELLGHKHLKTTMRYCHLTPATLETAMKHVRGALS